MNEALDLVSSLTLDSKSFRLSSNLTEVFWFGPSSFMDWSAKCSFNSAVAKDTTG